MTLTSRHFGQIDPSVLDETGVTATIDGGGGTRIDARLVVAHPHSLRQGFLDQADTVVDSFLQLDERARAAVLAAVSDEHSIPGRAFVTRRDNDPGRVVTPEDFTASLSVASVVIAPDGGASSPDRVSITYVSEAKHIDQRFMAVVREGVGLVFADAEQSPRASSTISYR